MIGQDDSLTSAFSLGIYTTTVTGTVTTCVQNYILCSLDAILLIHLMFTYVQPFLPEDIVNTVVPQMCVPTIAATGNVIAFTSVGFFVGTFAQVVSIPLYAASSMRGHSLGVPWTDIGYRQQYLQNDCKSTRTSIKMLVYHAVMFNDPPDQSYLLLSSKLEHIFLQIRITNNLESGSSSRSLLFLPLGELGSSSSWVSIFAQDLHCLNYFLLLLLLLCVLPSLISYVSINSTTAVAGFERDEPGDINNNVTMATRIVSMATHASITQIRVPICYCLLSGCLYALTWNALGWDQFSETPAIRLSYSIAGTINSCFGMVAILVNLLWIVVRVAYMALLYLHLSSTPARIELPLLLFLMVLLSSWRMFHLYTARPASRVISTEPVQLNSVFVLGPTAIFIFILLLVQSTHWLYCGSSLLGYLNSFTPTAVHCCSARQAFHCCLLLVQVHTQIFLYVPGIDTSVMSCNNLSGNSSHMTTC